MNPPPPRSTLFPYTTLFRSLQQSQVGQHAEPGRLHQDASADRLRPHRLFVKRHAMTALRQEQRRRRARKARSEEHTSELQSQFHLVCRLLLEKKKIDWPTLL